MSRQKRQAKQVAPSNPAGRVPSAASVDHAHAYRVRAAEELKPCFVLVMDSSVGDVTNVLDDLRTMLVLVVMYVKAKFIFVPTTIRPHELDCPTVVAAFRLELHVVIMRLAKPRMTAAMNNTPRAAPITASGLPPVPFHSPMMTPETLLALMAAISSRGQPA